MSDGHVEITDGEAWLHGVHISEWTGCGGYFQHQPKRVKKLLLHRKEILTMEQRMKQNNCEIIPIRMYFSDKNMVKIEVGIGKKKNQVDKRATIEGREDGREIRRVMKNISYD